MIPGTSSLHLVQLALHSLLLGLHYLGLNVGVVTRNDDGSDANASGDPQSYGFGKFEPKFSPLQAEGQFFYAAVKGVCALCLIFGSLVLLGYSLKRTDYLLTVGVLGGLLPFALGVVLLLLVLGFVHLGSTPPLNFFQHYPFQFQSRKTR
jgi:hypothetical protein